MCWLINTICKPPRRIRGKKSVEVTAPKKTKTSLTNRVGHLLLGKYNMPNTEVKF